MSGARWRLWAVRPTWGVNQPTWATPYRVMTQARLAGHASVTRKQTGAPSPEGPAAHGISD